MGVLQSTGLEVEHFTHPLKQKLNTGINAAESTASFSGPTTCRSRGTVKPRQGSSETKEAVRWQRSFTAVVMGRWGKAGRSAPLVQKSRIAWVCLSEDTLAD